MTAVINTAGYFIFPPTWIKPSLVCGYTVKDVVSFREKAGSIVAAVEHTQFWQETQSCITPNIDINLANKCHLLNHTQP